MITMQTGFALPGTVLKKHTKKNKKQDNSASAETYNSSNETDKENNNPFILSRQKNNRSRKKKRSTLKTKVENSTKMNLSEGILNHSANITHADVFNNLMDYIILPEHLMILGYPIESKLYPGQAMVFGNWFPNKNAKALIPQNYSLVFQNSKEVFTKRECFFKNNSEVSSEKKTCMRCKKSFLMSTQGEYLTHERCVYHWGKLQRSPTGESEAFHTCCNGMKGAKGCTTARLHVWSGIEPGRNGPFEGFVKTRQRKVPPPDGNYGVYAIDCEMCFTNIGLELAKICVVGLDGKVVYNTLVRPENSIVDYNTRFSGITRKDMSPHKKMKRLKDVQNDLMGFITADTVIVGHGLENDFRALRIIHNTVVDTAIIFPHAFGFPYKRSLKSLAHVYLGKDIQNGAHDSYEDAYSALELVLWKLKEDSTK